MNPTLSKPRIRQATPLDKDGYVHATRAGYELDHQFRWRYPHRHEFSDDAVAGTGFHFTNATKNENCTVLVAELPRLCNGIEMIDEEWVIVAGVVWEWKVLEEVEGESRTCLISSHLPPSHHPSIPQQLKRNKSNTKNPTPSKAPTGFSPPSSTRRDMNPPSNPLHNRHHLRREKIPRVKMGSQTPRTSRLRHRPTLSPTRRGKSSGRMGVAEGEGGKCTGYVDGESDGEGIVFEAWVWGGGCF